MRRRCNRSQEYKTDPGRAAKAYQRSAENTISPACVLLLCRKREVASDGSLQAKIKIAQIGHHLKNEDPDRIGVRPHVADENRRQQNRHDRSCPATTDICSCILEQTCFQ